MWCEHCAFKLYEAEKAYQSMPVLHMEQGKHCNMMDLVPCWTSGPRLALLTSHPVLKSIETRGSQLFDQSIMRVDSNVTESIEQVASEWLEADSSTGMVGAFFIIMGISLVLTLLAAATGKALLEVGEGEEGTNTVLSLIRAKFGKEARDALVACSQEWRAVGGDLMMKAHMDAHEALAKLEGARKSPGAFKMWLRHFLGAFMLSSLDGTVCGVKPELERWCLDTGCGLGMAQPLQRRAWKASVFLNVASSCVVATCSTSWTPRDCTSVSFSAPQISAQKSSARTVLPNPMRMLGSPTLTKST